MPRFHYDTPDYFADAYAFHISPLSPAAAIFFLLLIFRFLRFLRLLDFSLRFLRFRHFRFSLFMAFITFVCFFVRCRLRFFIDYWPSPFRHVAAFFVIFDFHYFIAAAAAFISPRHAIDFMIFAAAAAFFRH